jgi:NAD(P)-dependent dehydrogenase (short-subunit alcohol dehydrogenase family)
MTKLNFSLEGKVALVTGGSRGIGKAAAIGFAEAGADVVVASRKLPDLELVASEIRKLGRKALPVASHIARMEEINNLVQTACKEFGKIDILVNSAGTSPAMSPMIDLEERLWDSIVNLNLKGLVFLSQAVARVMKDHGGGSIINISSGSAFKHEPNVGVYSITKIAVIRVTEIMAQELAQYNIKVNAIAPGHVHTRMGDSIFEVLPKYKEELVKRIPMGRIGDPEELVGAMIYLASDASSYTTGETIVVDGGGRVCATG